MSDFDSVITPETAALKSTTITRVCALLLSANAATGMATGTAAVAHGAAAVGATVAGVQLVGALSMALGPLLSAGLGVWAISAARLRGRQLGQFNAFVTAFADTIYHLLGNSAPRWENTTYPAAVARGRSTAGRFLRGVSAQELARLRHRYRPMGEMGSRRAIIRVFGGYQQ